MSSPNQPTIASASGHRVFATFPVAVLTIVLNDREQVLLLSHPERPGKWEVVNGGLEAGETVWDGAMRECTEELGGEVRLRPIATLHALTVAYDEAISHMISLIFVAAYDGGDICPGDDMLGSRYQWADISAILAGQVNVIVPCGQPWLFARAQDVYKLWRADNVELQIKLTAPHK